MHCFRHILQIVRDNEAAEYLELNVGDNWRISEGKPTPELPMQILPVTMQGRRFTANCTGKIVTFHHQNRCLTAFRRCWDAVCTFNQAQKHFQRLLLMEERATIARELHDSLAQVLSYLRIQLTLLKRSIPEDNATAHERIMGRFFPRR